MRSMANYRSGRSLDCDLGLYAHGILGRRKMKKVSHSMETKETVPSVSPRAYAEFDTLASSCSAVLVLAVMEGSGLGEQVK